MWKQSILIASLVVMSLLASAQSGITHTYPLTAGPDKNPMKGWNSGWWDDYELSTVGFQYIKWSEFEPTDGNFDYTAVENVIKRPGSAGRHLILRLYADWYGENQNSDAGPRWLYTDYGVKRLQAPNGKYITDYNDSHYIIQAKEAIAALAMRYDHDPRVYTFQLGILGYWGEWHTFSYDDESFIIEESSMAEVLETYKEMFTNVKLMGRYPWLTPLAIETEIGFHNDFFSPTGHSRQFDNTISAKDHWIEGPIGGEAPPNLSTSDYNTLFGSAVGMNMIDQGHYSTMKVGENERPCMTNPNSQNCKGFMDMHRRMGYNLQIESASFPESLSSSDTLHTELKLKNIGVAPMYYDWDVQLALLDANDHPVTQFEVEYNISQIMPDGLSYTISHSQPLQMTSADDYVLALRLIQPAADDQKAQSWGLDARNTYVFFSNEIEVITGVWNADHALTGGWSILGNVSLDNTTPTEEELKLQSKISLSPNPTKDELNIHVAGMSTKSISVHDAMGRRIHTDLTDGIIQSETLDVSTLAKGIYHVIIATETGQILKRFMKD